MESVSPEFPVVLAVLLTWDLTANSYGMISRFGSTCLGRFWRELQKMLRKNESRNIASLRDVSKKTTTHNTPKVFRHTYTRDGTSSTGNSEMNWVSKRCLHPGPLLCNHFDPLLGNCCNSCNPRSAFFSSAPFRCIYRQPCERSQANGEESSGHNPSYPHVFSAIYTGLVITPCVN